MTDKLNTLENLTDCVTIGQEIAKNICDRAQDFAELPMSSTITGKEALLAFVETTKENYRVGDKPVDIAIDLLKATGEMS